jgi:hypothetical protein
VSLEIKDKVAKALFRRHLIDRVEVDRTNLGLSTLSDTNRHVYDRHRHELTEASVETSWAADGRNRAYWYALAGEVLRTLKGAPLSELPTRLSCEQCGGTGRVYVPTEAGLEPRAAKAQGKLALETCNTCGGSGVAPSSLGGKE